MKRGKLRGIEGLLSLGWVLTRRQLLMVNVFIGWSVADLERELRVAQEDYARGKTVTAAGSGDANVTERVEVPIRRRIEELLYALYRLDPVRYPAASVKRARRTQMVMYGGG